MGWLSDDPCALFLNSVACTVRGSSFCFHPLHPPRLDFPCWHKFLISVGNSAHKAGPTSIHLGNPGYKAGGVNAGGTLARGKGVVSSSGQVFDQPGFYQVIFSRDVSKCFYSATLGPATPDRVAYPGKISAAPRSANPNGVFIAVVSSNGG